MQPIVLINQHRHTAMIVAPSGENQLVIKLGKGKLTCIDAVYREINTEGYIGNNYPPKLAVFTTWCRSVQARRYLEEIVSNELTDALAFT